ncbi:MAG TPA: hypothetical protein VLB27_03680, partial [candidate division Zixibacteria bacterium]|nr:hypothetical protein [candidate division Zixibacteria bacterium]
SALRLTRYQRLTANYGPNLGLRRFAETAQRSTNHLTKRYCANVVGLTAETALADRTVRRRREIGLIARRNWLHSGRR